jgi:hypothetical protein
MKDGDLLWEEYGVSDTFSEDFPWVLSYTSEESLVIYTNDVGEGTYIV